MRHTKDCFIAATDTDAGKSFVTSLLLTQLQQQQVDVIALKPVACGIEHDGINPDVAQLQALQPHAPAINFHTNPRPVAPLFDQPVAREPLLHWCHHRIGQHQRTLIEGVGGLMVPLANGFTQLDWIMAMPEVHLVLVVPARLGSLSQMLTHLSLLDHLERHRLWLVINIQHKENAAFGEQCRQVVDQWFPWVQVEVLPPNGKNLPALTAWVITPRS